MPVYLAEVFLMLPMAYILVLGEIDISVGSIVCLSATMSCIVCNTGAPFIVVVLTALLVGTACGAVNGTGKRRKYFRFQYRRFPCNRRKNRKRTIHSFPGTHSWRDRSRNFRKKHFWTPCICNRYQPYHSILFRNPCTEDPYDHLHSYGNFCRTVCPVFGILFLWSKYHNR